MAEPTPQAAQQSALAQSRQQARIQGLREEAAVQEQRLQDVQQATARRDFSQQLAGQNFEQTPGVTWGDIRARRGRGLSQALRAQRRLGSEAALGKFQAEEDLASLGAQEAGVGQDEIQSAKLRSITAAMSLFATARGGASAEQKTSAAKEHVRKAVEKKAKAGFKRGIVFVVDGIAAVFDLGSWATFIVDWALYLFTFAWLNLQLIYGSYFTKGKSRVISPLDWDPIPINAIVPPIILHLALVTADLLIIFLGAVIFTFLVLFAVIAYQLSTDPIGSLTGLLTGSGLVGQFSDIVRGIFGL